MAYSDIYRQQVTLLIRTLPYVAEETAFALKGGTAINLFLRDMPRLSVDIDLTYLPVEPRAASLKAIDEAMTRIGERIAAGIPGARIALHRPQGLGIVTKVLVEEGGTRIKIEVTPVSRGCVYEPVTMSVSAFVEAEFGYAETQVVSFADLYAGKIVAALDRQHPRDLFDVRDLLAKEGVNDALRAAFVAYMLSHNRPMHEVLSPIRKDIEGEFVRGFEGMTDAPVDLAELITARERIIAIIVGAMPEAHRKFLISFKRGEADWSLLGSPGVANLPAVRWRQQNLDTLSREVRAAEVAKLEKVLLGDSHEG